MKYTFETFTEVLGRQLRNTRTGHGLTQEQLAEKVGVHATVISRMETGRQDMTVVQLRRAAHAIGLRASMILESAEAKAASLGIGVD